MTDSTNSTDHTSTQLKLFLLAVERTVEKVSEGVTIEEFRQILQKIESLKTKQKKINKLYSLLKQSIVDGSMAEINNMVDQDNLDEKFIILKEIIDSCNKSNSDNKPSTAWRPPRNVSEHIQSHIANVKLEKKMDLELYVQEKEESVKNLMNVIKTMRDSSQKLEDRMIELNCKVLKMNEKWQQIADSFINDLSE